MIFEILNKGKENAIPGKELQRFFSCDQRTLQAHVESERRAGKPILSKKATGGGFYLPATESEKDEFLGKKMQEIKTILETWQSIKYEKEKPLDPKIKSVLEAL